VCVCVRANTVSIFLFVFGCVSLCCMSCKQFIKIILNNCFASMYSVRAYYFLEICVCVCVCVCVRARSCACMCVCVCVQTHTHTHTNLSLWNYHFHQHTQGLCFKGKKGFVSLVCSENHFSNCSRTGIPTDDESPYVLASFMTCITSPFFLAERIWVEYQHLLFCKLKVCFDNDQQNWRD
jgi:hypothetical protein